MQWKSDNKGCPRVWDKLFFPLLSTVFKALQDDTRKEVETSLEEMLFAILCFENSDKAIFSDLKKRVENDCILNKADYQSTITTVQSLLLNYQPNYNSNSTSQSNGASNKRIFM